MDSLRQRAELVLANDKFGMKSEIPNGALLEQVDHILTRGPKYRTAANPTVVPTRTPRTHVAPSRLTKQKRW